MENQPVRAAAGWLALREPADAAARSTTLVAALRLRPPGAGPLEIHDLGGGSGSMARWLTPRLPGAQHWVIHDRDVDLLPLVHERPPGPAADGAPVTVETRVDDVSRLEAGELEGASLVTGSALLDMWTQPELDRVLDVVAGAGCPVLLTLSVTGEVELHPPDPLDGEVGRAFNDHQHRSAAEGPRLGPGAWRAAVDGLAGRGRAVTTERTPWRLGPDHLDLAHAWFAGWLGAAREEDPSLVARTADYARQRRADLASGRLRVTVHHRDLLAVPPSASAMSPHGWARSRCPATSATKPPEHARIGSGGSADEGARLRRSPTDPSGCPRCR